MDLQEAQSKNYYEILGVASDAPVELIRQVYKEIARVYHPDSNFYDEIMPVKPTTEQIEIFKIMTNAYHTLCDPKKRAEYDQKLQATMVNLRGWEDETPEMWNNDWKPMEGSPEEVRRPRPRFQSGPGLRPGNGGRPMPRQASARPVENARGSAPRAAAPFVIPTVGWVAVGVMSGVVLGTLLYVLMR